MTLIKSKHSSTNLFHESVTTSITNYNPSRSISTMPQSAYSMIQYAADHDLYVKRLAEIQLSNNGTTEEKLPADYPAKIESALTWDTDSFVESDWVVHLDSKHVQEICDAVKFFEGKLSYTKSPIAEKQRS